ncbi:hypothetical protein BH10PSE3_BH10PSE3_15430 [soil metagenome]
MVYPNFSGDQMTYTVLDRSGARILLAEGGVSNEEGARLDRAIQQAGAVDEVWLSSPGGNLAQGMAMGRVLHKRGLMARVPDAHACVSACTIAFLGAPLRSVDPTGYYGIHMFSGFFDDQRATEQKQQLQKLLAAADRIQKGGSDEMFRIYMMDMERSTAVSAGELARYLVEMSASLEFLSGMFGQKQLGVCYVNQAGLKRYNVVNTE